MSPCEPATVFAEKVRLTYVMGEPHTVKEFQDLHHVLTWDPQYIATSRRPHPPFS